MSLNEARMNAAHDAVRLLAAAKFRYLTPMTMTFMISYIGLALIYERVANNVFDPLAENAVAARR